MTIYNCMLGLAGLAIAEPLEKPLPKPRQDLLGYASARVLEALLEALLALRFLEEGYSRNAAGKAFQAWKALVASLLALEKDSILRRLGDEKEREWLLEIGIPRVPSGRLKPLARLIEKVGYSNFTHYTSTVLNLHDYQYHGPDPSGELSKYPDSQEAIEDIKDILLVLVRVVEEKAKPKLQRAGMWSKEHDEALNTLQEKLQNAGKELQQ